MTYRQCATKVTRSQRYEASFDPKTAKRILTTFPTFPQPDWRRPPFLFPFTTRPFQEPSYATWPRPARTFTTSLCLFLTSRARRRIYITAANITLVDTTSRPIAYWKRYSSRFFMPSWPLRLAGRKSARAQPPRLQPGLT